MPDVEVLPFWNCLITLYEIQCQVDTERCWTNQRYESKHFCGLLFLCLFNPYMGIGQWGWRVKLFLAVCYY